MNLTSTVRKGVLSAESISNIRRKNYFSKGKNYP